MTCMTLLIVDDHEVVRDGLAGIVGAQQDMTVVGMAGDGEEAISRYFELRPDVVILDLKMPKTDGFKALEAIIARDPQAKVLVMSTYDGDQDVYRALKCGATGYLLKDSSREFIVNAVRSVARGERFTSGAIAAKLMEHLASPDLTKRELEVLQLISEGRPNKEIARRLNIAEGTVKSHVKGLLFKLSAGSRTEVVTIAARRGYLTST